MEAGTYTSEVRPAGSTDIVLTIPGVTLTDEAAFTVFAKDVLMPPADNMNMLRSEIIRND